MADLLTIQTLGNLLMLLFLQAVLGFDNLLFISIESQRAPVDQQRAVRFWGIVLAVAFRVLMLFIVIHLLGALSAPFFVFGWEGVIEGGVNFATLVFLVGGVFISYTAVKEIAHMLTVDDLEADVEAREGRTGLEVLGVIVAMNTVFSFDSILSALAITDVFAVLAVAIVASGLAMLFLAETMTAFLQKNRMYQVLGLFILLIVGVVLLGEAGPAAAEAAGDESLVLRFFGYALVPMSKTTFYFAVIVLFAVEIIQSRYARSLAAERRARRNR